jgi:hypothetical protein
LAVERCTSSGSLEKDCKEYLLAETKIAHSRYLAEYGIRPDVKAKNKLAKEVYPLVVSRYGDVITRTALRKYVLRLLNRLNGREYPELNEEGRGNTPGEALRHGLDLTHRPQIDAKLREILGMEASLAEYNGNGKRALTG